MAPISRRGFMAGAFSASPAAKLIEQFARHGEGGGAPPAVEYDGPLYLSDVLTLIPGQTVQANNNALMNPLDVPMAIDGMDFAIRRQLYGGAIVSVQLSLNNFPLTGGSVPIWLLGRAHPVELGSGVAGANWGADAGTFCHSWDFNRPLIVPPGSGVTALFSHNGLLDTNMAVLVGYRCRALPRGTRLPKRLEVPYACAYLAQPRTTDDGSTVIYFTSNPSDLRAPENEEAPLDVQRITGRYFASYVATNALGDTTPIIDEVALDSIVNSGGDSFDALISMTASWDGAKVIGACPSVQGGGVLAVRGGVPFRMCFDRHTRSWEVPHTMPQNGWYRVRGSYPPRAFGNDIRLMQVQIGLNGSRMVDLGRKGRG